MTPEVINTAGLAANMVGTAIAFFYSYPQPSHDADVVVPLPDNKRIGDGRTVGEVKHDVRKQKARYSSLSHVGLGLMFAGFALQIVATWVEHSP